MISLNIQKRIIFLYKRGFSAVQIAESCEVSESGVRYYLKKHKVPIRSRSEAITLLYQTKFGKKPFKLKTNLSALDQILKTAGIMLYWGEGTKGHGSVAFSNSDPEMIKVFLKFLREICGTSEDRLRVSVHAYEDHNINELKKYWSNVTKISTKKFYKPYIHRQKTGTYRKSSKYGTISVQYNDKKLLDTINDWIVEFHCGLS